MSERWSADDVATYQARRKGMVLSEPGAKPRIIREVNHDYKADFEQQLSLVGIQVEHEYYFARPRKWRADWRVIGTVVLIEFEGGLFMESGGAHKAVGNMLRDIEKYNEAAIAGWIVIRVTPKHIPSGEALKWVEQAIKSHTHKETSQGIETLRTGE